MAWFLGLGITGVVLLALSLVFDGLLEGAFGGVLDGVLEGRLSLPVVAGSTAMTGFGGAIALGTGLAGPAREEPGRPARPDPLRNGKAESTG